VEDDLFVADFEKDGVFRFSLNDDGIITGSAEEEGNLSSGIGFGIDSSLGRFGEDGVTTGAIKRSIRQRA